MAKPREQQLGTITVLDEDGSGTITASNARITNVATPIGAADAATKDYVDGYIDLNNEWSEILTNGNVSGGTNPEISSGDRLQGEAGSTLDLFSDTGVTVGTPYVSVGTTPAASGLLRIPNNTYIRARNNAGGADVSICVVDTSDRIVLGGTTTSALHINTDGNTVAIFDTTFLSLGTNPAGTGALRLPNAAAGGLYLRNNGNSADIPGAYVDGSDHLIIGGGNAVAVGLDTTVAAAGNIWLHNPPAAWQTMIQGTFIADVNTAPTGNPAAGGFLWSATGALNWRTSSGAIHTLGSTYYAVGTTPATTGIIRLPNAQQINWRDSGDTADVEGITVDAAEAVVLGGTNCTAINLDVGAATIAIFDTTYMSLGTTPSTAGIIRLPNNELVTARDSGDSADVSMITVDANDDVVLGGTADIDTGLSLTDDGNLWIGTAPASWQSMTHGCFVSDATVVPDGNPASGIFTYSESGAGKARGSSGTITTWAPSEPHCPRCDSDFALQWENPKYGGTLAICAKCLVDALTKAGISTDDYAIALPGEV